VDLCFHFLRVRCSTISTLFPYTTLFRSRIEGFTASVGIQPLRQLADSAGISLIVDLGSGLLRPDATVPEEPDVQAQLAAGADIVIASGDKLLGGPQAGIMLGKKEAIAKVRKHPLARAVRIDKLRLNALEA